MEDFNWTCPYCNRQTTITKPNVREDTFNINLPIVGGSKALRSQAIACPNPECRNLAITAELFKVDLTADPHLEKPLKERLKRWNLLPSSHAKVFPDCIPAQLRSDYEEACAIRDFSAKASATLCRRCLQGMIRDFWQIKKSRLKDEIDALEEKIDSQTWETINSVREIGNIGAHMEKDVNLIIDVEVEEAELLISLIETLFQDWYVDREEKRKRNATLIAATAKKQQAKSPKSGKSVPT